MSDIQKLDNTKLETMMNNISNVWGHSSLGIEAKQATMSMLATKHGLYTKIPISCKAEACPYRETCIALKYGCAPEGELCPIETAQIELRYEGYSRDFDLDAGSFTDKALVSEIINLDVQLERCKALMASEGVPVVDVVAGVDENGTPLFRPEVSKFMEAYERTLEKRNKLYNLMEATRKDKKETQSTGMTLEDVLAQAVATEMGGGFVIDEKPDHL